MIFLRKNCLSGFINDNRKSIKVVNLKQPKEVNPIVFKKSHDFTATDVISWTEKNFELIRQDLASLKLQTMKTKKKKSKTNQKVLMKFQSVKKYIIHFGLGRKMREEKKRLIR